MSTTTAIPIRRELRDGDPHSILELHRRVYVPEYDRNEAFLAGVRRTIEVAVANGWPRGGGAWLVDHAGELSGSLALTDEGAGVGRVRWFVLAPGVRGQGLGGRLLGELVEQARRAGFARLELETFSALEVAGHLYRAAGFRVTSERRRDDWGPPIVYQHYDLEL